MSTNTSKASIVTAILGAVVAIVGAVITATFDRQVELAGIKFEPTQQVRLSDYRDLEAELDLIKSQVSALNSIPEETVVSVKLAKVEVEIEQLASKLDALNKVIMQSPEKAIEIPMLKRDISSLQKQYEYAVESLQNQITRAYDTMKWVIGTIVLGILGLAASILLKGRD